MPCAGTEPQAHHSFPPHSSLTVTGKEGQRREGKLLREGPSSPGGSRLGVVETEDRGTHPKAYYRERGVVLGCAPTFKHA